MKRIIWINLFILLIILLNFYGMKCEEVVFITLAGEWRFAIDTFDTGESERWFEGALPETINLPGSMLTNGKGFVPGPNTKWTGSIYDSSWFFNPRMEKYRQPGNIKFPFWLTPDFYLLSASPAFSSILSAIPSKPPFDMMIMIVGSSGLIFKKASFTISSTRSKR